MDWKFNEKRRVIGPGTFILKRTRKSKFAGPTRFVRSFSICSEEKYTSGQKTADYYWDRRNHKWSSFLYPLVPFGAVVDSTNRQVTVL